MTSAALGIGYSLWLRLRWVISGIVILMLLLALTVQLIPVSAPYCCGISVAILLFATVFFLNTFSFGPADLGVKSSGFPTHMRVLPVSTRALVGWPMLFAAETLAILWALPACLIFVPAGFPIPILWPAAMFAALCVWIQAISWSPFSSPFARVPALFVAMTPLILPLALGLTFFKGAALSAVVSACCLIWSATAYRFGVQGLSRARTGSEGDWFRAIMERWEARGRRRHSAGYRRRPFRSPFAAHLWYECRRNAIVLPVMTGFVGLPMLLMLSLLILNPSRQQSFVLGSTNVSAPMMIAAAWGGFPFLFAIMQGSGMAKLDIWGKMAMPAFFATRPMKTYQFVFLKLCSTALSAIGSWAVTFGLFSVWAVLEASPLNSHPSVIRAAWAEATPRAIFIVFFVLIGTVAMTWRNIVSGLWPTLLGRKHLANSIGFGFLTAYVLVGGAGAWIYQHPRFHAPFFTLLPWIVGALIVLKLCVAVWLSLALQRRGLITPMMMNLLGLGWLFLAGCILVAASLFVSPTWGLAAIVVMMLPFPSLAAAPLALQWNRHR